MQLNTGVDKRLCIRVMEAAELRISRSIMYALSNQGKLYVIIFGKSLRIPRAALIKRLEEGVTKCRE